MAFAILDRVLVSTPTTGTGSIGIGAAVAKYMTFAEAGIANGDTVRYVIEDGNDFEIGLGTYSVTGPTLSRSVIKSKISGVVGTTLLSLSGSAVVFATAAASDMAGAITGSGVDFTPGGAIIPIAGTTTKAPLGFHTGSLLTTAAAGAMEYDGLAPYFSHAASARGVLPAAQFARLTANYTLTSQTAAQKLFNTPVNGSFTAVANATYRFRCVFALNALSTTSSSFGFALGGTATKTEAWLSYASKSSWNGTGNPTITWNTAANTSIATAQPNANGMASIDGTINVTVAGTIIPQVSLGIAAAGVVQAGSFFEIWPIGANTVTSVGNWA